MSDNAAQRLTKPIWLIILGVAFVLGLYSAAYGGATGFLSVLAFVAAAIYLAGVRPKVREYSKRGRAGPYGPWSRSRSKPGQPERVSARRNPGLTGSTSEQQEGPRPGRRTPRTTPAWAARGSGRLRGQQAADPRGQLALGGGQRARGRALGCRAVPNRSSAVASSRASRPRTRSAWSSAIISTSSATVR